MKNPEDTGIARPKSQNKEKQNKKPKHRTRKCLCCFLENKSVNRKESNHFERAGKCEFNIDPVTRF